MFHGFVLALSIASFGQIVAQSDEGDEDLNPQPLPPIAEEGVTLDG